MRTITVVPYDPQWQADFTEIKEELLSALQGTALAVEHVGSTAVPGLWAKPVIDIDIVIAPNTFPVICRKLAVTGYRHKGDLGIKGREAFVYQNKPHLMEHHLYVCEEGSRELRRHLALRDYLRTDRDARTRYSGIKRKMASRYPHDIEGYLEGKAPVILDIYAKCGVLD